MTNVFFGKILLAFTLLHFLLQGQTCLLFQVSLDFLVLHVSPHDEKDIFFGVISYLELRFQKVFQVFIEPFNFSFFGITGWDIDLDYHDIEQFALEMNREHFVVFEIAPKYCILDSFVDYDGYFISSKGFLPTVVDSRYNGHLS